MKSSVVGTACAPNSVTKRASLGQLAMARGKSRSSPWYQPKYVWLSVPPEPGWGSTPEWAMTGRLPSACSRARLIEWSSTVLFQLGSCWATATRAATRFSEKGTPGSRKRVAARVAEAQQLPSWNKTELDRSEEHTLELQARPQRV